MLVDPTCRLITITGPGGSGKTRLALQAAGAHIGVYAYGLHFVALASISSAEFLVAAIADSFSFAFNGPQEPKTQLLGYLREKQLLLVLDNFSKICGASGPGSFGRTKE